MANEDKDTSLENPAARAFIFVSQFKELAPNYSSVKAIVAKMYNVKQVNVKVLTQKVSDVWLLPTQIRTELEQIPGLNTHPYLEVVGELENALTFLGLESNPDLFTRRINESLLRSLSMLSSLLNKDVDRPSLSDKQREEITEKLNGVKVDILQGDYDDEFKQFALDKVTAIIYAIESYDLLGVTEIISRVDQMFGGIVRQMPSIRTSDSKKSLAKKLFEAGAVVLMVLELANNSFSLEQNLKLSLSSQNATKVQKSAQAAEEPHKAK